MRLINQRVMIAAYVPEWHRRDVLLGQKVRRKHLELEGILWSIQAWANTIDMAVAWDLLLKQRSGMSA